MSPEQELLAKWRSLPKEKQKEVLDFVEFIHAKMVKPQHTSKSPLPASGEGIKGWGATTVRIITNSRHIILHL